ncbi:MAG TPA: Fe(2+)-trafficking protein [Gemmatimonadota bacterium]|nr:Fe(2+)-trafficking protein [Gemmatimonadota bacterium]
MTDVTCIRCGQTRAGLDRPPYPDAMGREIAEKVCANCWEECKRMQVMVINEYRLDLSDTRAQEILEKSIRDFLGIEAE